MLDNKLKLEICHKKQINEREKVRIVEELKEGGLDQNS